ncbi:hypothetical protein [Tumebacillus flagellatus]|uniref:DUF4435 domain-containing protein n=1 Tax=Tumebacillus flagellatus TaxID=1157490 RepID=A0A074LI02_9BACL|nr:hypothetical protein [Tumebacillus flagellatus]KEO81866.1 hypothetical protein EL26_18690 [Tumebacillus flagellatus]
MPVTQLFVEGEFDSNLISAVLQEADLEITVTPKGPKYGLQSKVLEERGRLGGTIFYLRDRDFDFGLTEIGDAPELLEANLDGVVTHLGWRWSRHEIENYVAEPAVLSEVASLVARRTISVEEVTNKLTESAQTLRFYQAARWTIGTAKKVLPPYNKEINSRPMKKEWRLPPAEALTAESNVQWVLDMTNPFLNQVQSVLNEQQIRADFEKYVELFSEANCNNIQWVLHMCSGKDLLTGLKDWFIELGFQSPKDVVSTVINHVVQHDPQLPLRHIPEFQAFCQLIQAIE